MRRAAVLGLLIAACGSEEPARKPAPAPKAPPVDAAPPPVTIPPELDKRYRLPVVRAEQTRPLPAGPIAWVTLGYIEGLRRGTVPPSLDGVVVEAPAQLAPGGTPPAPTTDGCADIEPPPTPLTITIAARKDLANPAAPLVLADRGAEAYTLAEVLHALDGASLGVAGSADAASAFSLGFKRAPPSSGDTSHTLYIYILDRQLELIVAGESYGGQITTDGALDTAALEANVGLARKGEGTGAIELLVAADQPVSLVVGVLDALVGAGVTELTIVVSPPGVSPGSNPGGVGGGRGSLRSRSPAPASLREGMPKTTGGGDTVTTVRRYVRRQRQKLQYCYERELPRDPEIAGPVKTTWIVRADGTVADLHVDGPSRAVDACWRCVLERIQFPAPKDGKPYDVAMPFTLVAPGGD